MSSAETLLEQASDIRAHAIAQPRISVTELARSVAWRKSLKRDKIMEVVDRNNQVGWLLSPEGMQALLDTIDYFESELERVQVAYLLAQRSGDEDWAKGAALAQGATEYLEANLDAMQAAIDAD